jgi:hypothetical protein
MSNHKKYGPQTAEIEAFFAQAKTVTPEQARALSEAWDVERSREPLKGLDTARVPSWNLMDAVRIALRRAGREDEWSAVLHAAPEALASETWDEAPEMAIVPVHDALVALLARDLITPDQFDRLYEPWASVMDEQIEEQPVAMTDLAAARASIEGGESVARLVSKLKDTAIDLFFEVESLRKQTSELKSQLAQVITRARLQKERDAKTIADLRSQIGQSELKEIMSRKNETPE